MVRASALLAAALFLAGAAVGANFVRSDEVNADCFLFEGSADSASASEQTIIWTSIDGVDRVPLMTFTVPTLAANETLDSAHVVVEATASALDSATCKVFPLLRSVTYAQATWNEYATGSSWQTAGAHGALDYDQDSLLYSFVNPTVNPESIFVARGADFTTYINAHLGDTITLVWHDIGNGAGQWTAASLEHDTELAPTLRLFGTRTNAARRRVMP